MSYIGLVRQRRKSWDSFVFALPSVIIKSMKVIFAIGAFAMLLAVGELPFLSAPIGYTQTIATAATSTSYVDFTTAVQAGVQVLAANSIAQTEQQQIKSQDYKSTWDEFGINVMVDGATPVADVNNQVVSDIAQSTAISQNYNQQEADYLQGQQITPEQVQASEQSVGIDLPPTEQIDTHPSIGANPDVNISPADVPVPEDNASSSETGTSDINASTSALAEILTTTIAGANASATVVATTSTAPVARIKIAKNVDNAMPQLGATINYTLTVSALGPNTSTEVMATDILPVGITFVSSTLSAGTYNNSNGEWNIGDMAASSTATLVITALVNASDTAGQSIPNMATVSESSIEANPNQDDASSSVVVTIAAGDNMIFNAILQSEQSQPAISTEGTTATIPSDGAPSDVVPPSENTPSTQ